MAGGSGGGRAPRGLAVLHEVVLLALAAGALWQGASGWIPLVRTLDPAVGVGSGPWHGPASGIGWTWPALAVAFVAAVAGIRAPVRRFVAMVLQRRNLVPGLIVGVAGAGAVRLAVGVAAAWVTSPALHLSGPALLATLAWWTAAAAVGGRFLAGRLGEAGHPAPSTAAAAWALTWRTVAMLLPITLGALAFAALCVSVAWLPLAARSSLGMPPEPPVAGSAGAHLLALWTSLLAGWVGAVVAAMSTVVPGHVFWRVVEQLSAPAVPTGSAEPAPGARSAQRQPRPETRSEAR